MINNPFARPRQTLTDKVGKEILNRITSGKWPAGFRKLFKTPISERWGSRFV